MKSKYTEIWAGRLFTNLKILVASEEGVENKIRNVIQLRFQLSKILFENENENKYGKNLMYYKCTW